MKKLIIGLIIGLMLGMSTNAFAAVGESVTATFAQFNYMVNGEAKAVDSPVLTYEGASYLRTTDLANMLGYDVTYKADARTIEFSGGPEPIVTPAPVPSGEPTPTVEPAPLPQDGVTATPPPATTEPTPTPAPTPTATPALDNTSACQAIRDDYNVKIVMVQYGPGSTGNHRQQILILEYERDQALSAAGC